MAQAIRQSELLAGNDWLAIYRAFTEVNLNAFDYTSIRESMVDYIRRNYPEDFNDWIESSEFVAIIDLLAYLGQSLAFRMDINARENFLDLARRRESVLRIARSLSYNAKRNYPARGLAKLTEIRTTHDVYDSNGRNLNNTLIRWDDPTNPDWFEQWILVLNSALVNTNPFGYPIDTQKVDGISTQLYRLDNVPISAGNFPFTTNVNGQSLPFDVVNPSISSTFGVTEQEPNPYGAFHIIYKNDGNGNSSPNTGFFVYIKQGTLMKEDVVIPEPQENRTILIDTPNINETDFWVQSVTDNGTILSDGRWTRVGFVPSDDMVKVLLTTENITYNGVDPEIQNLYQAITQEDDRVLVRFGDGRFGRSPVGNLRIWYRVSANQNLTIRPEDIKDVQVTIPYLTSNNIQKRLTLSFSIQESIINGVTSETNEEVRRRASRVASTQGRMVSGSDYNEFPIQTNLAVKLKAVNRIYSGQSRYLDLNDPTGSYQNTKVFSDDGSIFVTDDYEYVEVSHDLANSDEIISRYISNMVNSYKLRDFVRYNTTNDEYDKFSSAFLSNPDVKSKIEQNLEYNQTFGLSFNFDEDTWEVIDSNDLSPDLSDYYSKTGSTRWLIYCEYTPLTWRFTCRGITYVFESEKSCRFYFVKDYKGIDPQTGKSGSDFISVLKKPNGLHLSPNPIQTDVKWDLSDSFYYNDGYLEAKRVKIRYNESNHLNVNSFLNKLKSTLDSDKVVHMIATSIDGYRYEKLVKRINPDYDTLEPNEYGYFYITGNRYLEIYKGKSDGSLERVDEVDSSPGMYWVYDDSIGKDFVIIVRDGVQGVIFQWQHFAPSDHRIDPSVSNIIDVFVLTREYYSQMISWRDSGASLHNLPKPPSELQLKMAFSELEKYKMSSDEVIWRPAKFKLLFGESADSMFQAKFKVVKLQGTTMSDGEIKSRVIESIRTFFDISLWDFGETFYFSLLSAFIHRQLSTAISSVEIVPVNGSMNFGDLREIHCQPDEIFFSTAQVSDVEIINANTAANLRIQKW